jgi:hypothetical protein
VVRKTNEVHLSALKAETFDADARRSTYPSAAFNKIIVWVVD